MNTNNQANQSLSWWYTVQNVIPILVQFLIQTMILVINPGYESLIHISLNVKINWFTSLLWEISFHKNIAEWLFRHNLLKILYKANFTVHSSCRKQTSVVKHDSLKLHCWNVWSRKWFPKCEQQQQFIKNGQSSSKKSLFLIFWTEECS